jgi:hypothetical protein
MTKLILCLLMFVGCYAYGSMVNCANGSGDANAIQTAVNAGGTVTISGTCSIMSPIKVSNSVTINGPATLNSNPSIIYAFALNSDNVTFNNLTFVGAGIYSTGANLGKRSNIVITSNTFRDFVANPYKGAIETDRIAVNWFIAGNLFQNFWHGGYPNSTVNPLDKVGNSVAAIVIFGGLDHTTISNNTFDQMENDSMHFFNQGLIANSGGYTASGVVISGNFFTRQHRIALEYQDASSRTACAGGCNNSAVANTGTVIKNNYYHLPAWPYWGSYAWSVPTFGNNAYFYNNTAIVENVIRYNHHYLIAFAWELGPLPVNLLLQGNIVSSLDANPTFPWASAVINYPPGSTTNTYTNNLFCGNINSPVINSPAYGGGANTQIANYTHTGTCPGGVGTAVSGINTAFTSPDNQTLLSGDIGTWDVSVVSNLSINSVQFFIDSSSTPVVTQEIQDVNKNFANDLKWLYHASIDTSGLTPGSHTVSAKAMDISGASQTVSQSFTTN